MLKVLMLDFGDTLARNEVVIAGVPEALNAFSNFELENGEPLELCIVSDFQLAVPPTEENISTKFDEYVELTEGTGLLEYFDPIEERVTLSTHANAFKPNRRVFELAIERMGMDVQLSECIFITENAEHIRVARDELEMTVLHFVPQVDQPETEFSDWANAPGLVAGLLGAPGLVNQTTAIQALISVTADLKNVIVIERTPNGIVKANATSLHQINETRLGKYADLNVPIPVEVEGKIRVDGSFELLRTVKPSQRDLDELAQNTTALFESGKIDEEPSGVSDHTIEIDQKGRKVLKRRGFR